METLTVAIGTRNRGDSVVRTIRSVQASDHPSWAIRIVDQSDDDRTAAAVAPFLGDSRIRYRRSPTAGVARARNAAMAEAAGELVLVTDDDCELAPDCMREIDAAFAVDARVAIVFGNILAGPHDGGKGFVPACVRDAPALARGLRDKNRIDGAAACMAIRRSAWRALAGFDERFGLGTPLHSGEEVDLTIRALRMGFFVHQTPRVRVTHHGFYRWSDHRAVIEQYWYGTGAAFGRNAVADPLGIAVVLGGLARRWATGVSPVASSLGTRAHRFVRLSAFTRGFAAGLQTVPQASALPVRDAAA
jgi:GT2 family glycosyltransferase